MKTASKVRPSQRFFASNNLCVAYTKSGDLDSAKLACDEAVRLAPTEETVAMRSTATIDRRYRALALSNRGVLRALAGEDASAREDFEAAINLKGGLSAPERNLAYLEIRDAQATTALQTGR